MKLKLPYKVFLNGLNAILEVQGKTVAVYLVNADGTSELLQESPYEPKAGEKEEEYFVDYLSGEALRTIDVLTTSFNYDVLIGNFRMLQELVREGVYSPQHFSMEMSYIFVDFEDVLKQLAHLTEEDSYAVKAKEATEFFQEYFYSRTTEYSTEDFAVIHQFFDKQIAYLESLKSN